MSSGLGHNKIFFLRTALKSQWSIRHTFLSCTHSVSGCRSSSDKFCVSFISGLKKQLPLRMVLLFMVQSRIACELTVVSSGQKNKISSKGPRTQNRKHQNLITLAACCNCYKIFGALLGSWPVHFSSHIRKAFCPVVLRPVS